MAEGGLKEIYLYRVKEIFYSLQGEGFHAGRAAVFIRFSGCNLWSGLESDRDLVLCDFCDTDFTGADGNLGGMYEAESLVETTLSLWPGFEPPFVVCTGGEPMLQLDDRLIAALRSKGCATAVETNGTIPVVPDIDWITVSPKAKATLRQISGNELKLVYPQTGLDPSQYEGLAFEHFFLQPIAHPNYPNAVMESVEYCLARPKWKLSLQIHKLTGIK